MINVVTALVAMDSERPVINRDMVYIKPVGVDA